MCSVLSALLALSLPLAAGVESVGTTSATFTKLGSGPRAAALGEAYVAVADDAEGLAYNPAGMAQMLTGEFEATHAEWFQSLLYENMNAVFSLGDGGMFGLTLNTLIAPSVEGTKANGQNNTIDPTLNYTDTGSFSPYDLQVGVSYARPIYPNLSGGVTLKMLAQSLDSLDAFGIGLDLGLIYTTPLSGLKAGFAAQNLGTPIKFYKEGFDLPMLFRLGGDYAVPQTRLHVMPEFDLPMDESPVLAIGAEYDVDGVFFPRAGYRYNNIFNPWSLGFGLRWDLWGTDFSVVPYGELGMTYRASLSYRFGNPSASIQSSFPYLSSTRAAGGGAQVSLSCAAPDKVTAWALYIYGGNPRPAILRTFHGRGAPPSEALWDGRDDHGRALPEGPYNAVLSLRYATGQVVVSPWLRLEVDNTPPQGLLMPTTRLANGTDLVVPARFQVSLRDTRVPEVWRLEVLGPDGRVFRTLESREAQPQELVWDGKGEHGESYFSGQVYHFRLTVIDKLGNRSQAPDQAYRCIFAQ
jgi:hypothetical protein